MATNFIKYIVSFVLVGLFIFCLLGFMITTQIDNLGENKLYSESNLSIFSNNLYGNLSSFNDVATIQKNESESESINLNPAGAFMLGSIGKTIVRLPGFVYNFVTSFFYLAEIYLGIPAIITQTLFAIVILTLIFLWWKNLKQGE